MLKSVDMAERAMQRSLHFPQISIHFLLDISPQDFFTLPERLQEINLFHRSTGCYEIEIWYERHTICCPHFLARHHMWYASTLDF